MASKDNDILDDIKESVKNTSHSISEIIGERIFKPMYFYFIIAWSITNWKFIYVFLFANEKIIVEQKSILKIEYLTDIYQWSSKYEIFISTLYLFIIPAISTFIVVWWLSKLSAIFFEKNEEHKQEINAIKRKILYKDKVDYAKEQRKIRDTESDKKDIKYEDNKEFNEYFDSLNEEIKVANTNFKSSEVLYSNDYDLYIEAVTEFEEKNNADN